MCVFCKIVKKEIPVYQIYQDNKVLAFLDIAPATYGHVLIVTKKHYPNVFELPEAEAKHLFMVAVKLSKRIKDILDISNINLIHNSGFLAGQTVEHFHLHIIPRTSKNEISFGYDSLSLTHEDFSVLQEKLSKNENV